MAWQDNDLLVLDKETFYDVGYSLTQMTYHEYIHDEKFHLQGFSYSMNGAKPKWVTAKDTEAVLRSFDWSNITLVCQNTHFDASILYWKFGIKPNFYIDTMLIGRLLVPGTVSLDALCKMFFPHDKTKWKGKELIQFKGHRVLGEQQDKIMGGYCNQDVYITGHLFAAMLPHVPDDELRVMDMTLRMAYNRLVQAEIPTLEEAIAEEVEKKREYIATYTREKLVSNNKFADLLIDAGIEPPMKISARTEKLTYAFSKKDKGLIDLQLDPVAAPLIEARLAVKSNITETRAQRFIDCMNTMGYLPVFLNYSGARATNRWSGGQKLNIQNMGRGSKIRASIKAPSGYKYVVCDLSQVEVRVLAWLTGNEVVIKAFMHGIDPYISFAAGLFDVDIKTVTKAQRQEAKAAVLSLGFQAGARSFRNVAEIIYGVKLSPERAQEIVNAYRRINYKVVQAWGMAQELLSQMANDPTMSYKLPNGVEFLYHAVKKPSGIYLNFDQLHFHVDKEEPNKSGMVYGIGRDRNYMYGGKLIQNITQSVARDIIAWQMLQIKDQLGLGSVCSVHDELWYLVPDDKAEQAYKDVQQVMCSSPEWFKGVPLDSEGGFDDYYANIK